MTLGHHRVWGLTLALIGSLSLASVAAGACLSKPVKGPDGTTHKAHVIAPANQVGRYRALGFVPEQCGALAQLEQAVNNICRMAANTPSSVQAYLTHSRGVSLSELCASGRAGLAEMQASKKP